MNQLQAVLSMILMPCRMEMIILQLQRLLGLQQQWHCACRTSRLQKQEIFNQIDWCFASSVKLTSKRNRSWKYSNLALSLPSLPFLKSKLKLSVWIFNPIPSVIQQKSQVFSGDVKSIDRDYKETLQKLLQKNRFRMNRIPHTMEKLPIYGYTQK